MSSPRSQAQLGKPITRVPSLVASTTHAATKQSRSKLTITKRALVVTVVACCVAVAVLVSLSFSLHDRQLGSHLSLLGMQHLPLSFPLSIPFALSDWTGYDSGSDRDVESEILRDNSELDSDSSVGGDKELGKGSLEGANAAVAEVDPLHCGLWGTDRTLEPKARANIRQALKLPPGVPALTRQEREELGSPCSRRWRRLVSRHFRRMKWKSKVLVATASMDRVCGPIDALKRSMEEGDDEAERMRGVSPGPLSLPKDRLAPSGGDSSSRPGDGSQGSGAPLPSLADCVDEDADAPNPPPVPPLNASLYYPERAGARSSRPRARSRRARSSRSRLRSPLPLQNSPRPDNSQLPAGEGTRRSLLQVEALGFGKRSPALGTAGEGNTGAGLPYSSGRRILRGGGVWRSRDRGRRMRGKLRRRGWRRRRGHRNEEQAVADLEGTEVDHIGFGGCWPNQVPCSPGVQVRQAPHALVAATPAPHSYLLLRGAEQGAPGGPCASCTTERRRKRGCSSFHSFLPAHSESGPLLPLPCLPYLPVLSLQSPPQVSVCS